MKALNFRNMLQKFNIFVKIKIAKKEKESEYEINKKSNK